jgi:hypothetical protein
METVYAYISIPLLGNKTHISTSYFIRYNIEPEDYTTGWAAEKLGFDMRPGQEMLLF